MNWLSKEVEAKELDKKTIRMTGFGIGKIQDIVIDTDEKIDKVIDEYSLYKSSMPPAIYQVFKDALSAIRDAQDKFETVYSELEQLGIEDKGK